MQGVSVGSRQGRPRAPLPPIKFGEWLPDMPEIDNPGCVNVQDVIPFGPGGYKPFPDFAESSTTALSGVCLGAVTATGSDGIVYSYAGDATTLYYLNGSVWTSATTGYTLSAPEERWEFVKVPNADKMLACSIGEDVQVITLSGTTFSAYFTSTLKPKATHMAQVGSFLMLLNVDEGGTRYPDRLRWSSITDPADMDASAANQSDSEDLGGEYGWGQRLIGGTTGTAFLERAIFRATYVGSPSVFRIDPVETNRGALAPGGVIRVGRMIYFLAHDGFFLWDGLESHPIGDRKVNKFFFDNADSNYHDAIATALDPENQVIMWSFASTSATGGVPDRILMYHWPSGWWGKAHVTTEFIQTGFTTGLTLEQLDNISGSIDALPFSLDSKAWEGGIVQATGFNSSHQSGTFSGSNLAATIDTGVRQLHPGKSSLVSGAIPVVDGGTPTVAVAGAKRMNDTFTFETAVAQTTDGNVPLRNKNRYHKFRLVMAAGGSWTHASGVQPIASETGQK